MMNLFSERRQKGKAEKDFLCAIETLRNIVEGGTLYDEEIELLFWFRCDGDAVSKMFRSLADMAKNAPRPGSFGP